MEIKNQVVVITGASTGIGRATALALSKLGAKVVLGARRASKLESLVAEIKQNGGDAVYQITDVTDFSQVKKLIDVAVTQFGRVDVLFNNAGVIPVGSLSDLSVMSTEHLVDVNIKGVLYGIKAVLPVMHQQGSGHIITTGSNASHVITPEFATYASTKFAVRAIMDGLRQEEIGNHIRATLIAPGTVNTNLYESISDPVKQQQSKEFVAAHGMNPAVIANAVIYALEQPDNIGVNEVLIRDVEQAD
ncbi:oxidoreductase [Paucilactobacillus hokkaidonensis JCM 18461]|uniref:Oxidoreductase n=2 Tax=Paucilactobacillus hokkaidonensis TaxID=1193095 RepID=A0A0A1GWQ2_9LACO|nr:SDR family oxidoreductase [Paucilactobacillus hokkaidonensis]KRO09265.1 short-chain dehydrogenase reductase SDR [Paucilactobacillus hokkaidonensis]BAP85404.1 oxidoreductase [Paucilactobacillus hokkaidonensis JCM 18461]